MRVTFAILFILTFASCKKTEDVQLHLDYQPLESGKFIVYDAQKIFHDDASNVHDTTYFQLKVLIGDDFIDNEGRPNKEYKRFKSTDNGVTWTISDVWYMYGDLVRFELIEENQRKGKLAFAPTIEKEWDVNAYNTLDELKARYEDIHDKYVISGTEFDLYNYDSSR